MYKIIIADDEPSVIEGLELMVDWGKYGFQIAGTALNGQEAYELIKRLRPPLALIDIKMPLIDGIELIKRLYYENIDCKAIILTAYADSDYARECLKYGVRRFLTKPLDIEEIGEALSYYRELFDRSSRAENLIEKHRNDVKKKTYALRSIAAVKYSKNISYSSPLPNVSVYDNTAGMVSYIIGSDDNIERDTDEFFKAVLSRDKNAVGCFKYCDDTHDEQECFNAVSETLIRSLELEPGKIYTVRPHGNNSIKAQDFSDYANRLHDAVEFCDERAAFEAIDEFFKILPDCKTPILYAKMFFSYVIIYFNRILISRKRSEGSFDTEFEARDMFYVSDYLRHVKELSSYVINELVELGSKSSETPFAAVERYLAEHFREQIVIKDLAKLMYTSPGYLGTVFTKEKGMSIKEYVHGLRMEETIRLMPDKSRSISDIAYEVGYNNYNHFYMQFEKHFGMTPGDYRKQISE